MIKVVNGFKNALLVLIIVVAGHVLLAPPPPPGGRGGGGRGCVGKSWHDPFYWPEPQSFRSLQERQVALQRSAMLRQQQTQLRERERQMQQQQQARRSHLGGGDCDGRAPRGASLRVLPPYPSLSGAGREPAGPSSSGAARSLESDCAEELRKFVSEDLPGPGGALPPDQRQGGVPPRGQSEHSLPPAVDGSFEETSSWFSPI
jgi:hypothetical protein